MALYADENFPLRVVEELRRLGIDVLTVHEDGRSNQSLSDPDILTRAIELGVPDHSGIIICTEDPDRVGQAQRIVESIAASEDLRGLLIRVYRPA
jgi:predicted nuclease of predicted toxin-antitoxin system